MKRRDWLLALLGIGATYVLELEGYQSTEALTALRDAGALIAQELGCKFLVLTKETSIKREQEAPAAVLRELLAIYDASHTECDDALYDSDTVTVWERARQILGLVEEDSLAAPAEMVTNGLIRNEQDD